MEVVISTWKFTYSGLMKETNNQHANKTGKFTKYAMKNNNNLSRGRISLRSNTLRKPESKTAEALGV